MLFFGFHLFPQGDGARGGNNASLAFMINLFSSFLSYAYMLESSSVVFPTAAAMNTVIYIRTRVFEIIFSLSGNKLFILFYCHTTWPHGICDL